MSEGIKHDSEKPRMGLISSIFLTGLARVLTFGAKKYDSHNWRKGLLHSRCYDALQRHLTAWNDGEDLDEETQLNHLDHAACELMFLRELVETHPTLDDRHKRLVKLIELTRKDYEEDLMAGPEKKISSYKNYTAMVVDLSKKGSSDFTTYRWSCPHCDEVEQYNLFEMVQKNHNARCRVLPLSGMAVNISPLDFKCVSCGSASLSCYMGCRNIPLEEVDIEKPL